MCHFRVKSQVNRARVRVKSQVFVLQVKSSQVPSLKNCKIDLYSLVFKAAEVGVFIEFPLARWQCPEMALLKGIS